MQMNGAIPYNSRSQLISGMFYEVLLPGCFAASLRSRPVFAFAHHNPEKVLASTQAGTLKVTETASELRVEIDPVDADYARALENLIHRGDVRGLSFGFQTKKDHWRQEGNVTIRDVIEATLLEVSPVATPAYKESSIGLRSSVPQLETKYRRLELLERE